MAAVEYDQNDDDAPKWLAENLQGLYQVLVLGCSRLLPRGSAQSVGCAHAQSFAPLLATLLSAYLCLLVLVKPLLSAVMMA